MRCLRAWLDDQAKNPWLMGHAKRWDIVGVYPGTRSVQRYPCCPLLSMTWRRWWSGCSLILQAGRSRAYVWGQGRAGQPKRSTELEKIEQNLCEFWQEHVQSPAMGREAPLDKGWGMTGWGAAILRRTWDLGRKQAAHETAECSGSK